MPATVACLDPGVLDAAFQDDSHARADNAARFGMILLIGAEIMFFAGFVSAFIAFRAGAESWPPAGQPRLPVFVTLFNTAFLMASAFTMRRGLRSIRSGRTAELARFMTATAALGGLFLVLQGYEWIGLLRHGMTLSSSIYGAIFYTIIGTHGLHVAAAMTLLLFVLSRARASRYHSTRHLGVELCAMFWYFVVGIWPILYGLLYWS